MAKQFFHNEGIDYLVRRRFPLSSLLNVGPSLGSGGPPPDTRELRIAVDAFRNELAALTPEELAARVSKERAREFEQLRAKAEQEERERFYNQPHARADFVHWAKAAHWTLDEAIALSFGRAPEIVRWEKLQKFAAYDWPFLTQYVRRRDLALRAKAWEQLYDPVLPGLFLAWAKRTDIEVPPELIEEVESRGVQVADWKSLYEDAATALKVAKATLEARIADWKQLSERAQAALVAEQDRAIEIIDGKSRQIASLQERVALLEGVPEKPRVEEKSLATRERESLLKLIIGMARGGYAYDPKLSRSNVPQEIADDLAKHDVVLDVDTVRKWLREAAQLMPGG